MTDTDRQRTLYPALCLGILTAAFIIVKTGRDALFFQGKGIFHLPVAIMMITATDCPDVRDRASMFFQTIASAG